MTSILTVVDHASNHVPADIELGIDPELLETHIAWDIGAAAVADALGFPAHKAKVSRLVVDMNREQDSPALVPRSSDGHVIPGNHGDVSDRVALWEAYHAELASRVRQERPRLIVSMHSFTPRLATDPDTIRPWQIGILYNHDERAARMAIELLEKAGVIVGDQLPYSGRMLNATMNRHAEANGIAYLGLEIRQDLIGDSAGVEKWALLLRPVIETTAAGIR